MNWLKQAIRSFSTTFFLSIFVGFSLILFAYSWFAPTIIQRLSGVETRFAQEAGRPAWTIAAELFAGYRLEPLTEPQRWLILGTDIVTGSNRHDVLTDTILLASYDPASNTLRMLSFPRDIYLPEQRMRINALYQSLAKKGDTSPETGVQTIVSSMIGKPISGTIVVSLNELAEIVDVMGGLPITVPTSFTDPSFPRSGVDVTVERDPDVLYETVRFEAGPQVMDGESAVKYIRSRKALELEEAGDEARARRQRMVIEALLQRIQSTEILGNPVVLGKLYDWYSRFLLPKVPLPLLGQLAKTALDQEQELKLVSVSMPITERPNATDSATLFVHPPERKYNGAWVYEPVDPTWKQLQKFIQETGF